MTHPAIDCAIRTGYGPNNQDVEYKRPLGKPKRVKKDDRFYAFLLKHNMINENGEFEQ